MSNRDSMGFGDLLPQDVVQVFAQEKHSKRGRKKRSHSLGRALGWLKGKKRNNLGSNGQDLGLGPALDLALDGHPAALQTGHKGGQKSGRQTQQHGNNQAVLKRADDDKTPAPLPLQENVFIEASRPKYLEDLHTEALEGLKMMQQEETNDGAEYQDNESTISTLTVHTDGEGGGFMTDSTIPDTSSVASVQSSVSTRSSRSGLTRQGSTFRPLNSGKKSEKSKRRRHRRTVAGIPHHVQKELGLDRVGWKMNQKLEEEQLYNGETDESPTDARPQQAAQSQKGEIARLLDIKVIQPLNNNVEQRCATDAGHRDDLALLHHLGPDLSDGDRPRSLAVPWMTTANSIQQDPPSPVMTMSPQAAYMSKIIPNAVLPSSIDVVEINRGQSRNSLRTVSKSSLLLASPAPSRPSSRASSSRTTSSHASTITSASHHNPRNLSDSSCWSNSESTETLVSDSSTISRGSTPRQKKDGDASARENKVNAHSISNASKCSSNGMLMGKVGAAKKEGQFVRSLSVMKAKKAPPPPSRSYSLHNKMKRRSRDLAEITVISGESSLRGGFPSGEKNEKNKSGPIDSPGYNADTSSLDDSTGSVSFSPIKSKALNTGETEKSEEHVSQDSAEKKEPLQENKLTKIISPSSGYSSQDATSPQHSKQPRRSSPKHKRGILAKLQKLFPGSTSAGSTSSSLTQQQNAQNAKFTQSDTRDSVDTVAVSPSVRTLRELFNIPLPPHIHAPPPPPPEVWAHSKRSVELLLGPPVPDNIYAIIKKNPKDRRQQRQPPSASTEGAAKSSINGSLHVMERKKVQESVILNAEMEKDNNERLTQNVDLKENCKVTEIVQTARVSDILNGMLVKAAEKREERLAAVMREETKTPSTQTTHIRTNVDTSPAISLVHISPTPSPTVSHHPPQLLAQQNTSGRIVVSPESSWPPPPPPVSQVGGPDVSDFPLPPPPLFGEVGLALPLQVPPERSTTTSSVASVVTTEHIKVATEVEAQSSSSQGNAPPPLSIPPPPPYTAPHPPVKAVSSPTNKKVCVPLVEIFPPPSAPAKEFSPPPPEEIPSPPPIEFSPPPPIEFCAPLPEFSLTSPKEVSITPTKEVCLMRAKQSPPPVVQDIVAFPLLTQEIPAQSTKEVTLFSYPSQENSTQSSVEEVLVRKLSPPQSIPPPPPLPLHLKLSQQNIDLPKENILPKSEMNPDTLDNIPLHVELLSQPQVVPTKTDGPTTHEVSQLPFSKTLIAEAPETCPSPGKTQEPATSPNANIPIPPPLPVINIKHQSCSTSTENQTQELASACIQQEDPTPIVTTSLIQMVKLRSVNSSPEAPKAQEQPQMEVTMRKQQLTNQVPTSTTNAEAPQKPIRRSLIITPPISTSPPVIVTSQPASPESQSPSASSSTVPSPTKKSPPAIIASPSMNLQEVIRLRTAARSKESPGSRLSLHSPTSPIDFHKSPRSPSSTASFIFSRSNKKVIIETKPVSETKTSVHSLGMSSVTKVVNESASHMKAAKVPPPVAKKPISKTKENETSEEMEQTAVQEAEQESVQGTAEKTNGTSGTAEEGEIAST